jgi:hypothetical protein
MVAGAIALLVSGCGDGGGPPSPRRGARDPAALVKVSGADLSIINRDRLLAGTRWQGRADSIGTWPLSEADRAELPSLRECAHGAEIGWAFRRTRPLGHTETDRTLSPRDSVGVVELFAPLRSLGRGALEQGLRDGVTRCASKRHMRTRVMGRGMRRFSTAGPRRGACADPRKPGMLCSLRPRHQAPVAATPPGSSA